MKMLSSIVSLVALVLTVFAANSEAGQINGVTWFSGVASVAGESVAPAAAINNDNQVGLSPNQVYILQKDYHAIGPVDIVLSVLPSGGVTEYAVIEGVQNSTGIDWTSYHIELGFGTGAGFVKSTAGDGLDFDAPDVDSDFFFNPGPGFPTVNVTEDDIIASGGVVPYLAYAGNFVFHVDVPDGITEFTIRQSPVIPEPASAVMLILGGLLAMRRSV